jgi:hypothetical protein
METRAGKRFLLGLYFVRREWLTHYYDDKEWVRGTTEGKVTNLFSRTVQDGAYRLIPLIPLGRLAKALGYAKASTLMLQIARYYAVPLVPLATSKKQRRWFVVPCYGFFQFLREEFGLSLDQIQFVEYVDITGLSEQGKRLVLGGLVKHDQAFDKIGKIVFVTGEVLRECFNLDQVEMSRWSFKTVLTKGFKALRRCKPLTLVRNQGGPQDTSALVRYLSETAVHEINSLRGELGLYDRDIAAFLDQMERLVSDALIDTSDELQRAYVRLHADSADDWWDAANETINPMFAIYYEARRRVLCNIFRRAKFSENCIRVYPQYWSPKKNSLLTRALNASYKRLLEKNEELFRKLQAKQVACVRVVTSVLKEKVLSVPVPIEAIDRLKSQLKVGEAVVKMFLRWTYEFFGFKGLKCVLFADKQAAQTLRSVTMSFHQQLETAFAQFFRLFWTLSNAASPPFAFENPWSAIAVPDY